MVAVVAGNPPLESSKGEPRSAEGSRGTPVRVPRRLGGGPATREPPNGPSRSERARGGQPKAIRPRQPPKGGRGRRRGIGRKQREQGGVSPQHPQKGGHFLGPTGIEGGRLRPTGQRVDPSGGDELSGGPSLSEGRSCRGNPIRGKKTSESVSVCGRVGGWA